MRGMDRIDLFRIFARVVETASFTRAADSLGLPRSTVSAAVQELEGRLGTRLLHRTTRKVAPTLDGEAFHERAMRVIAEVEETEALFREAGRRPVGRLRIDVPGRIGRRILAPALPDFLDRHPGVEIALGMSDRAVNLIEDSVDGVIRVGPLADSGLIARPIGLVRLINVASPAYLARRGVPREPGDLVGHDAVRYASPTTGRVEDWEWREGETVKSLALAGRVSANSAEACIACCLAGLGLLQIPAFDVRLHIEAGELVEVMPDHLADAMPLTLLYPHRHHLSYRFKVFADWLEALMRREVLGEG